MFIGCHGYVAVDIMHLLLWICDIACHGYVECVHMEFCVATGEKQGQLLVFSI